MDVAKVISQVKETVEAILALALILNLDPTNPSGAEKKATAVKQIKEAALVNGLPVPESILNFVLPILVDFTVGRMKNSPEYQNFIAALKLG